MNKKIILILCLTMGLVLSACGSNTTDDRIRDMEDKTTETQERSDGIQTENAKSESTKTEDQAAVSAADGGANEAEPSASDEEIFMQFINGEISAQIDAKFESDLDYAGVIYDYSSGDSTYAFDTTGMTSLKELINNIIDNTDSLNSDNRAKTYYAITNTFSGKPILAVKIENLGIYSPDDDSYALFIFAVSDGQLYMTYAYDSWARSMVGIFDDMIFLGYGSAGAGDSFRWAFYIDGTGHYKSLYELEMLSDEWITMYGNYSLQMDSSGSWSADCLVCLLTTPYGNYYAYEAGDTVDKEKLDIFTSLLEAKGMVKTDDMIDVIDAIYKDNDIPDNLSDFEGWIQYN